MEDKKLTFNEKEVNETIDYCIKKHHEAFSIPVCKDGVEWALRGWRCAGGNRKQGYRAYKKLYAAGILQRINKKIYYLTPYGGYLELHRDDHERLINMIISAGEARLLDRLSTNEVHPYFDALTDIAKDYMFMERIPGIKLFSAPYMLLNLEKEDAFKLSEMVIDGLRKLKAFYEERIAEGEDIGHPDLETEVDEELGMKRLKRGYITIKENGQERRIYYRSAYSRVEPFDVLSFMDEEHLHELRQLQTDIENMINYVG